MLRNGSFTHSTINIGAVLYKIAIFAIPLAIETNRYSGDGFSIY